MFVEFSLETVRLSVSHLVIALIHSQKGGTMVMSRHRPKAWIACELMYMLSKFSSIRPSKPCAVYKISSMGMGTGHASHLLTRRHRDQSPKCITLSIEGLHGIAIAELNDINIPGDHVEEVLRIFGAQLVNKSRIASKGE
ncbi:hypothetical protein CONLIGDRAFT_685932 [Coniochaeta ligniaria NRRL 30616]|uniref:Uncharacterized protein n=1 Tax=Coniochaeta ligniaria NRRL 30616 TaxID=1408157 RepID=A0A1J7J9U6_9PEZI|nr:hypothetical protein CONLIGDRAFT_685932 [Coniochaeta ligniaria NRRL 30616]